ncbi:hypothetical protein DMENIID0001_109600 [Sergentomyia squamirostris]
MDRKKLIGNIIDVVKEENSINTDDFDCDIRESLGSSENIDSYEIETLEPSIEINEKSSSEIESNQEMLEDPDNFMQCTCPICSKSLDNYKLYKEHMEQHFKENPYICKICYQVFIHKHTFENHLSGHEKKTISCIYCNKSFARKEYLTRHFRRVHRGIPKKITDKIFCTICQVTFETLDSLKIHSKIHNSERLYECPTCGKKLIGQGNMRKHKLLAHTEKNSSSNNFQCPDCEKSFRMKSHFLEHLIVHKDDKPFECTQCPQVFKRKKTLVRHLLSHSKPSKPKNESSRTVRRRPKKNTSEEICKERISPEIASLSTENNPKSIEEVQPGSQSEVSIQDTQVLQIYNIEEMSFKCLYCLETFESSTMLNLHLNDLKKADLNYVYLCLACGEEFQYQCQLRQHKKQDHKCPDCKFSLLSQDDWYKHLRECPANRKKISTETKV